MLGLRHARARRQVPGDPLRGEEAEAICCGYMPCSAARAAGLSEGRLALRGVFGRSRAVGVVVVGLRLVGMKSSLGSWEGVRWNFG